MRAAELAECLHRNLKNPQIDEICVLLEKSAPPLPRSAKVRVEQISERPTYRDYFDWINRVASAVDISIIANSDIFFDSQIGFFRTWQMAPRVAFALARWEAGSGTTSFLNDRNDSQDAWIFRGQVGEVNANFGVGIPRCDNRIAKELQLSGYQVDNPSFSIRAFHLHAGKRDEYSTELNPEFIPPPYAYKWPHNLLSLPRTIFHNWRHPHSRIEWRHDRRQTAQALRLDLVTRCLRLFPKMGRSRKA